MKIFLLARMITYLHHEISIFKLSVLCEEVISLASTQAQMKLSFTGKKMEEGLKAKSFNKVYVKTL